MRTKNSADTVHQALTALFSQDRRDFELVVVDSGSTDATLEIVRRFPCRVRCLRPEQYYPGPVLNAAVEDAQSGIIVFQNSDVVPLNGGALSALVAPFADPAVKATFARQLPRPEAETWVRRDYETAFPASGEAPSWLPYSLPFAAMRRNAWDQQPFYSDAWGSEDTHWGHRARQRGWQVRYVPESRVMHSHNYDLRQLFGRRFIEGEADAFIYRQQPSLAGFATGFLASVGRDLAAHLRARDAVGLLRAPARRLVFHWAHLRGQLHGTQRRRTGNTDPSHGQRVVLERYG
jgi:rhamnosyltransferase